MTDYVKIKEGVDITNLQPAIVEKLWPIAKIFDTYGLDCVVTSARRPPVGAKSWHHFGLALDFRANHISTESQKLKILSEIIAVCGNDYDVILHGEGANIHYHVEFDPN